MYVLEIDAIYHIGAQAINSYSEKNFEIYEILHLPHFKSKSHLFIFTKFRSSSLNGFNIRIKSIFDSVMLELNFVLKAF